MNERLDNINGLLADLIESTNANSDEIWSAIQSETESVGYTVTDEMEAIWANADAVVSQYGDDFSDQLTTVNQTIIDVGSQITAAIANTSGIATEQNGSTTSATETTSGITATTNSGSSTSSGSNDSSESASSSSADNASLLKKVKKIINAAPVKTEKAYSSKSHSDLSKYIYKKSGGHAVTNADMADIGTVLGISATEKKITGNKDLKNKILKSLKAVGYASGVKGLKQDELAWTQENGPEAIIRPSDSAVLTPLKAGDSVLNADATSNLYDWLNNPRAFLEKHSDLVPSFHFPTPDIPEISVDIPDAVGRFAESGGNNIENMNVNITLPNVKNYDEFKYALQHDPKFEKMVQAMTVGRAAGGSPLRKYRY